MISVSAIDHVNLSVADPERSRDFYRRVFGLEVLEDGISEGSGRRYIIVGAGGVAVALHQAPDPAPDESAWLHPGRANHWGFVVEDVVAAKAELQRLGVTLGFDGEIIQYPRSRSLYVEDPDGHEIELSDVHAGGLLDT